MPYISHPSLREPEQNQKLWRYIDFTKFTALIQKKNLYFPSLNQFALTDPWEGLPSNLNFHTDNTISENMIRLQKKSFLDLKKTFYVSCWHMNDSESDSQWKIYGVNPMSLAIISDFRKLKEAITDSRAIHGGKVIYYNPEREMTSAYVIHQPIIKRSAFEHEKEFRLIFWDHASINKEHTVEGIPIAVEIEKLIERIVISPHAPAWFAEVVTSIIKDYGYKLPIHKSNLLKPLIY